MWAIRHNMGWSMVPKKLSMATEKKKKVSTQLYLQICTNKGVDITVEAYYDPKEDSSPIFREDVSWEGKLNYVRNELASFSSKRKGGYPRQIKKKQSTNMY